MTQTQKHPIRKVAIFAVVAFLAGCGSEKTTKVPISVSKAKAVDLQSMPTGADTRKNINPVDMVLNGKLHKLQYLACSEMSTFSMYVATSTDESQIMKVRLKANAKSVMPESFRFTIKDGDTQVTWLSENLEIEKTGEKRFNINGTAKGTGMRLDSDGNYKTDPALKPKNDVPMQASFTCS